MHILQIFFTDLSSFPSWVQTDLENDFKQYRSNTKPNTWDFDNYTLHVKLSDLFNLVRPRLHTGMTFDGIFSQINQVFVLETKTGC